LKSDVIKAREIMAGKPEARAPASAPAKEKGSDYAAFKLLISFMSRVGLEPTTHWLKADGR